MSNTRRYNSYVRGVVRKRSGGKCELCSIVFITNLEYPHSNASMHHRFKRCNGGKDTITNLIRICFTCHTGVHQNEQAGLYKGLILNGKSDFSYDTPVLLAQGWVYLTPRGFYKIAEETAA